jgi:serine/threonine-protein kinase
MGMAMGTPAFMAPEQALGYWHEVDGRSDLWSVGATLFTLLTGRVVHEAHTAQETLVRAATRPAPAVAFHRPALDPAFAAVIDRALAFSRADRWPDARAMQRALRETAPART